MIRKIMTGLAVLLLAASAFAGFKGPGATARTATVKEAMTMPDDSEVVLTGHLVKKLQDEHYLFRDDTGTIEVEIEDETFRGQDGAPQDKIKIAGEVDLDGRRVSVDVDRVEKLP